MTDFNAEVIEEFRANGGKVGGPLAGQEMLLVTHVGAKTGTVRTNPLGYFDDDGTPVLFASMMGAPSNPQWFHNLVANPDVTVELGDDHFTARARVVDGAEREALWDRILVDKPFLGQHQEKAGARVIPLIRLERT
jgi:deazaflavin-dependent oxidoreductase (nitroreductase family)